MERQTVIVDKVTGYLKKIYPKSATASEIAKALGIQACSADPWISSMLANRQIEVTGKRGRSNLFRLKL